MIELITGEHYLDDMGNVYEYSGGKEQYGSVSNKCTFIRDKNKQTVFYIEINNEIVPHHSNDFIKEHRLGKILHKIDLKTFKEEYPEYFI